MQRLQNAAIQQFFTLLQQNQQSSAAFLPQSATAFPHAIALHGKYVIDNKLKLFTFSIEMATEWKQKGKEEEAQDLRSEHNESPSSDKSRELVRHHEIY